MISHSDNHSPCRHQGREDGGEEQGPEEEQGAPELHGGGGDVGVAGSVDADVDVVINCQCGNGPLRPMGTADPSVERCHWPARGVERTGREIRISNQERLLRIREIRLPFYSSSNLALVGRSKRYDEPLFLRSVWISGHTNCQSSSKLLEVNCGENTVNLIHNMACISCSNNHAHRLLNQTGFASSTFH